MDWTLAHTSVETHVLINLMEGLITYDSQMKVAPSLAEKWVVSKDGKTYTFTLKKGVLWSDGVPLRAQDFVYSWRRLLAPGTAAAYAYILFDIVGAEDFNKGLIKDFSQVGLKALDDRTLQVRLKSPVAHWIHIPAFWVTFPLREDVLTRQGSAWAKPGRMVTVGPYQLAVHDMDSRIVLKANPNYHGRKGNIDKVEFLIVKDNTTALNLFEAGKLDFLSDLPALDLPRLQKNPRLKTFPYLKTVYLGLTINRYPLTQIEVRRAIAMGIDKKKMVSLLHGGQIPATTFVPPPLFAHSREIGLPFDPERGKLELRKAGWRVDQKLKLELLIPNWDNPMTVAQFVQEQLKKNLGLDVSVQPFDHKTFRAQVDLKAYPFWILSWGADFPDPDNFLSVFQGFSGNNRTSWKNASYDRLITEARGERQESVRKRKYDEAQRLLQEKDVAMVPLYYEPNKALVSARVKGLELNPLNYLYLREVRLDSASVRR